ncbi:hypothetical protein KAZ82_02390 [Candidatus Babeliales bacterium]|nr:hypothetical protein [Candidatus Babeliales bacterium]
MEDFMGGWSGCRMCGVRKQINRMAECKYCPTSRVIKKMKDSISRVKNKLQDLWSKRKKRS